MQKFDAIIIGSGQAGNPLAFRLANEGMKVALIEKGPFGGTCVNVGCTPTKAYVASARRIWDAHHSLELGIHIPTGVRADLKLIKQRKEKLVKKSRDGIAQGISENEHITFFDGKASFTGPKRVLVNDEQLTAEEIYINVGSSPRIPEEFRDPSFLTNESILELEDLPEHLMIIGGGPIGLEFAQMFRRFGSKVTIIEQRKNLVQREDLKTSESILQILKNEGIRFHLETTCIRASVEEDNYICLHLESKSATEILRGSHLLLAMGRKPNTEDLGLEKAGIAKDDKNFIKVNDYLETNVPQVFALGDCNGRGAFTHTSYNDYEIIVANKFEGRDRKVTDRIQTYGIYIDPPLGRAGLTSKEAKAQGYKVLEANYDMNKVARAIEKNETQGYMSVLVDADNEKILGATVLGVGGDEIISSILNLMYAGKSYKIIRDSVVPHPSVSELIPTMLQSLQEA